MKSSRPGQRGAFGLVASPTAPLHKAVSIEHRVDRAVRRSMDVRIQSTKPLSNLRSAPARLVLLELNDELLDLHRKLISVSAWPPRAVGQTFQAAILVAVDAK